MELSEQDKLRLQVLLANKPLAIRIDESRMKVHALSARGEMEIQLNATCRDEMYLRYVRQLLSTHVLGSPEGYPIYLRRWTRMGQARKLESLEQLLLLGEPEAIVAVVHAPDLTPEIAHRAWWAMPEAENARRMLYHREIVHSDLGRELAQYLVDYLPFEEDALTLVESVSLALQDDLLDGETRLRLWQKGRQKNAYYLGFMITLPDALPDPVAAHADAERLGRLVEPLAARGNGLAAALLRVMSAAGQTFLAGAEQVLRKPLNQDIVNRWLEVVADYFAAARMSAAESELSELLEIAEQACVEPVHPEVRDILQICPEARVLLIPMAVLAGLSYAVVRPVFSRSDAIGSLMRRKLEPVTTPLLEQLHGLRRPLPLRNAATDAR